MIDIIKTSSRLLASLIIGGAYVLAFPLLGLSGFITTLRTKKEGVSTVFQKLKPAQKKGC